MMTRLQFATRLLQVMTPLLDDSPAGRELRAATLCFESQDTMQAFTHIDQAVQIGFADGYQTNSPAPWLAAAAAKFIRP